MEAIETIEYKNHKIKIYQDNDYESPQAWDNDEMFIVYNHRNFTVKVDGFDPNSIFDFLQAKNDYKIACDCLKKAKAELKAVKASILLFDHKEELKAAKKGIMESKEAKKEAFENLENEKNFDEYQIFTLFAYIHSGVSLSIGRNSYPFNCRFDTSSTGFVLIKKDAWDLDKHRVSYPELSEKTDNDIYELFAEGLVESWNDCLSGNVYRYEIEAENCDFVDSCSGFYGNYNKNGMIEECKHTIDNKIQSDIKKYGIQLELEFV